MQPYSCDGTVRAGRDEQICVVNTGASNEWSYKNGESRSDDRYEALADLLTARNDDAKNAIDTLFRGLIETFGLDVVQVSVKDAAQDLFVEARLDHVGMMRAETTFQFEFTVGHNAGVFIACSSRAGFPDRVERFALAVAARNVARHVEVWLRDRHRSVMSDHDRTPVYRQLRAMLDLMPVMAWSSLPDGHADFFNDQWFRYTALTPEQSKEWGWTDALHPDDYRRAMDHWCEMIGADRHDDAGFEVRLRRGDGEYRWFWLRANRVRDEAGMIQRWYVTLTDIHDRKLAEESGRRSQALLSEAQRLAGLGIFSWRVGADHMSWSETLYRMFGFEAATPIDRSIIETRTHPDDHVFMFDNVKREDGLENLEDEIRLVMPDGSIRYLHYCAYVTTALTGEAEYVGTVQDITERYRASEALAQARADFVQAARASSLGVLTASIAHEVNQPLAGIVTNANVCFRMLSSDPPNIVGAIATAQRTIRDGKRAAAVISRLRTLFNQQKLESSWWDLDGAAGEVIELVQSELRRHRVSLVPRFESGFRKIKGDRIQLQQVIMNLLRNAIDAINLTTDGPRVIVVEVKDCDDSACLSVRDSGIGYDESTADDMFKAFYTTKANGMGIGLSVSRSIVNAHGGKLWAKKHSGRGATFGFSIPVGRDMNNEPGADNCDPDSRSGEPTP
ncbi:PAS domain-containing sensor histidine kinase [Paraburkholderia sp. ZP32-5]|uniref:PAS domain-containing sensor histidine kinase n=1 Tax=Paraburkholderia sp. ZP32-5 TaxID=2883245 RepID=UPI001F23825F|nr:PAS domain-containing sensor histidine kinase [Paraburkholderia sp. ZP32-5]